jgi:hypothetical protein
VAQLPGTKPAVSGSVPVAFLVSNTTSPADKILPGFMQVFYSKTVDTAPPMQTSAMCQGMPTNNPMHGHSIYIRTRVMIHAQYWTLANLRGGLDRSNCFT